MSTAVEQRIVEMKFDNKGFAAGVKDTLHQLDTLDKAAKFEGSAAAFQKIQAAADNVKFDKLIDGIQSISGSLENMQSFGFQVFQNLSNKAIDLVTNTVKDLSVNQIAGGFNEYELKMDSVRTIMNSSGESIETVNKYLQELNDYSDQTIYSFSDMTSSIGKFTNAGVKLDDAVLAIKGISNEAAVSGANAQQASAAMYNFAQALSSGSVKLIDWKSIENANMATVEFKKALIDTAVELGTVKEAEGGYISTTADAKGKVSELFTQTLGFNDSLSSQWLTTDVLVKTLGRYADANDELGQKAYKAAQEVTTFSKMMDALKESVGSGWAQTFEILFGDLNEAKKLWTSINDVVSGFIAGISDTRNGILEMWKAADGHKNLMHGLKNIWFIVQNIGKYIGLALETLTGHRYLQNFERVTSFFADRKNFAGNIVVIQRISDLLIDVSEKFNTITRRIAKEFNPRLLSSRHLLEEIYQCAQAIIIPIRFVTKIVTGLASKFLPIIFKIVAGGLRLAIHLISRIGYALTEGGLQQKLYDLADLIVNGIGGAFDTLYKTIVGFANTIARVLGFKDALSMIMAIADGLSTVLFGAIGLVLTGFTKLGGAIQELTKVAGPKFEQLKTKVENLTKSFKNFLDTNPSFKKLKDSVNGFFNSFKNTNKLEGFSGGVEDRMNALRKAGYDLHDAMLYAARSGKEVRNASDLFKKAGANLRIFFAAIKISKPMTAFLGFIDNLKATLAQNGAVQVIQNFFAPFTTAVSDIFGDVKLSDQFKQFGDMFAAFFEHLKSIDTSTVKSTLEGIGSAIWSLLGSLKDFAKVKFESLVARVKALWKQLFSKELTQSKPGSGIFDNLKTTITKGLQGIIAGIKGFKWSSVGKLIKAFISIFVIKKILGMFNKANGLTGSIKDTMKGISKTVNNFADATSMTKWQVAADAFRVFAESVLKLVGAIVILSLIPEDALQKALGAIVIIGLVAVAAMVVKEKLLDAKDAAEEGGTAATAIKGVGKIIGESIKEFGKNLIAGITGALKKAALAMLIIALGITISLLVGVLEKLKGLTAPEFFASLGKTLALVGLLAVALLAFEAISPIITKFIGAHSVQYLGLAAVLLSIGGAIKKMAVVIEMMADIPWDKYKSGLGKMALTILALAAALFLFEFINAIIPGNLTKLSTGLLLMALALSTMMIPIGILAAIPVEALQKAMNALVTMAVVLGGLSLALGGAVRLAGGLQALAVAILSIVGVAAGLFIFSLAIQTLVSQSDAIQKNATMLVALAAGVAVFAAVLGGIGEFLGVGLLAVGAGFALLGAGLLMAASAVDVFADASVKFANSMDTIINSVKGREKDVVSSISTIVYAAVKGLMDGLVYALAALLAGIDDALIVLEQKAFSIGEHLTLVLLKVLAGIVVGLLKAVGEAFGFIGKWAVDALMGQLDADPADYEGKAAAAGSMLYDANAKHVVPSAVKSADEVNKAYSDGIQYNYQTGMWENFAKKQSSEIDAGTEGIKESARHAGYEVKESFGESMNDPGEGAGSKMMGRAAREIKAGTPEAKQAAETAGNEVAEALDPSDDVAMDFEALKTQFPEQFGDLQNLIDSNGSLDFSSLYSGIGTGVEEGGEEATAANNEVIQQLMEQYQGADWNSIGEEGQTDIADALKEYGGLPVGEAGDISDDMIDKYINANYGGAGQYSTQELADGMDAGTPLVRNAGTRVSSAGADAAGSQRPKWESTGVGLIQGLANAINEKSYLVENASSSMMTRSVGAMRKAADEHSPSKETYHIGWFLIKGFLNVIRDKGGMAVNAGSNMVTDMLDAIREAMATIPSIMDSDINYNPTITPVLDTTRFNSGLSNLTAALNGNRYETLGANLSVGKVDVGTAVGDLSAITTQGNSDLLSAIQRQNDELARLNYNLENQKIYLDGNTLVGKTVARMDQALGRRAVMAGGRR